MLTSLCKVFKVSGIFKRFWGESAENDVDGHGKTSLVLRQREGVMANYFIEVILKWSTLRHITIFRDETAARR